MAEPCVSVFLRTKNEWRNARCIRPIDGSFKGHRQRACYLVWVREWQKQSDQISVDVPPYLRVSSHWNATVLTDMWRSMWQTSKFICRKRTRTDATIKKREWLPNWAFRLGLLKSDQTWTLVIKSRGDRKFVLRFCCFFQNHKAKPR